MNRITDYANSSTLYEHPGNPSVLSVDEQLIAKNIQKSKWVTRFEIGKNMMQAQYYSKNTILSRPTLTYIRYIFTHFEC